MINDFALNDEESRKNRDLMAHFYEHIAPGRQRDYFDGDTNFEKKVQQKMDVDLAIRSETGSWEGYEEKIIKWPVDKNAPHPFFYAETESCTNPGIISYGWMRTCEADYLIYVFEYPNGGLDIHKITFQPFKKWFWDEMRKNPRRFWDSRNQDKNRTQGKLVPIQEVYRRIPAERYALNPNGECQQIKPYTNLMALWIPTPQVAQQALETVKAITSEPEEEIVLPYDPGMLEAERLLQERDKKFS